MPYIYNDEDNAPMEEYAMEIPFFYPDDIPEGEETYELDT